MTAKTNNTSKIDSVLKQFTEMTSAMSNNLELWTTYLTTNQGLLTTELIDKVRWSMQMVAIKSKKTLYENYGVITPKLKLEEVLTLIADSLKLKMINRYTNDEGYIVCLGNDTTFIKLAGNHMVNVSYIPVYYDILTLDKEAADPGVIKRITS